MMLYLDAKCTLAGMRYLPIWACNRSSPCSLITAQARALRLGIRTVLSPSGLGATDTTAIGRRWSVCQLNWCVCCGFVLRCCRPRPGRRRAAQRAEEPISLLVCAFVPRAVRARPALHSAASSTAAATCRLQTSTHTTRHCRRTAPHSPTTSVGYPSGVESCGPSLHFFNPTISTAKTSVCRS